jgi:hypothetical protein
MGGGNIVQVANLVAVEMQVQDSNGTCITRIDNSTATPPRHVVQVENIGKPPRGIKIRASLPNGMTRLEFVNGAQSTANWDKHVVNVPCNSKRNLESELRRKSAGRNEPLQCDEVQHARGSSINFKPLRSSNVPFDIIVDVA